VDLFLLAGNPLDVLAAAGIELGRTYPLPIVDRAKARKSALLGYEAMRVKAGA
jgi:deoxyribodipyrimidine photo-lyase